MGRVAKVLAGSGFFFVAAFIALLCHTNRLQIPHQNTKEPVLVPAEATHWHGVAKVWISMGLCFDKNTPLHGKLHYPYAEVTPLAMLLWRHFFPDPERVELLLQIVTTSSTTTAHMKAYEQTLAPLKAKIRWIFSGDLDCVLHSQLIRMFAFAHPDVHPQDLVATVDVNLFPASPLLLEPIRQHPGKLAWVYQYDRTANSSACNGETFNQNLIVMPAGIWRAVLQAPSRITQAWLSAQQSRLKLSGTDHWYDDQWITTSALLQHRICSLPPSCSLWNSTGTEIDAEFDDSDTCWHGSDLYDCNKNIRIVPHGCKWWHFYPDQNFQEHLDKFHELTGSEYHIDLMSVLAPKSLSPIGLVS